MNVEAVVETAGVVPVMTVEDADDVIRAGEALVRGGIACLEVTLRTDVAVEAIRRACWVPGLLVGAGTLLRPDDIDVAIDAGARFGAAPGTDEAVIRRADKLGFPFFPGVATPTEIGRAHGLGARVLKLFPVALVGGCAFLRAMAGPFPDARFVVTGGVGANDVAEYRALSNVMAVGGSWMVAPSLVQAGRFDEVERLARTAAAAAHR